MKKLISFMLCALLVLGMLAGCNKSGAKDNGTTPTDDGAGITNTETAGSFVVTANASVAVTYGTDGLVVKVEGANEEGTNLLESYEDLMGSSCAEVVTKIIKDSSVRTNLGRLNYVVVKYDKGSGAPGTNFREGIENAAKEAVEIVAPKAKLVIITEDMLDADGYIDLKTAKALVEGYLGIDRVDGFDGTDKPVDGFYSFFVTYDGMEESFHVNAVTGSVGEDAIDGAIQDPEETEQPEETDPPVDPTEGTEAPPAVNDESDTTPETTEAAA